MKKFTALALAFVMLLLAVPAFGILASAEELTLPYTTKVSENFPTENFMESGERTATFHGNWKPIAYPTGSYGKASALLELNTVINVKADAANTGDGFLAPNGMWQFESAPVMRIKGDGAYWSVTGSLGWKSTHTVGFRYTAEYTGTVDLSFERLHGVRAGKTTYVAVFVNGTMVWPTENGTAEKNGGIWYADWYALSSTANISAAVNADPLLKGISLTAGDTVEFMLAGEDGSTIFSANTVVIRPVVTYVANTADNPDAPAEPNPDEPGTSDTHESKLTDNLPTNTFNTDGTRTANFSAQWLPIAYPAGSFGSASAMLVMDTIINVKTGGTDTDGFYAPSGMWQFETAPVVRINSGNGYWGDAGSLGCKETHTVGWQYTANKTGLADITFEKLVKPERAGACYIAVFVNGEMIWPTAGGSAADPYSDWYSLSGTADIAETLNGNEMLTGLTLSKGDTVQFMMAGAKGSTVFSANTVTMLPVVSYTALIEAPRPGHASIALGKELALDLYVDETSVLEGSTDLGAYINGKFVAAADGCIRVGGIAAKNVADKIKIVPTCTFGGKELKGEEIALSAADVLMLYVTGEDVTEETRNLAIATLNYATAAQDFFGYNVGDVANAGLTGEQTTVKYSGTYTDITARKGEASANIATPHSASLIIGDTVGFKFVFTNVSDGFVANYRVALLDENGKAVATVTPIRCDGQATTCKAIFEGILPENWNTAYTVAVISAGDNGETPTPIGETLTYSVTSYLARIAPNSIIMKYTLVPAMYAMYEAAVGYWGEATEMN